MVKVYFLNKITGNRERCRMVKKVAGAKKVGGAGFVSFLSVSKQNYLNLILSE